MIFRRSIFIPANRAGLCNDFVVIKQNGVTTGRFFFSRPVKGPQCARYHFGCLTKKQIGGKLGGMEREKALEILKEHTASKNLVNHGLAVGGVMRHFAAAKGFDAKYWENTGLLHDVDYEKYPDAHLKHTEEILKPYGVSDEQIHSIITHGYGLCSDLKPEHYMEKVLFAIDELTGLCIACALVYPDKKLENVTVESVLKKWKKKEFARGANREVIEQGAQMLEMPLEELISETLIGLKNIAAQLGL